MRSMFRVLRSLRVVAKTVCTLSVHKGLAMKNLSIVHLRTSETVTASAHKNNLYKWPGTANLCKRVWCFAVKLASALFFVSGVAGSLSTPPRENAVLSCMYIGVENFGVEKI